MGNCQTTLCDNEVDGKGSAYLNHGFVIADLLLFSKANDLIYYTFEQTTQKLQTKEIVLPPKSTLMKTIEDTLNDLSRETFERLGRSDLS